MKTKNFPEKTSKRRLRAYVRKNGLILPSNTKLFAQAVAVESFISDTKLRLGKTKRLKTAIKFV